MDNVWLASALWVGLALAAAVMQNWVAVSVALLEIIVGAVAGNVILNPAVDSRRGSNLCSRFSTVAGGSTRLQACGRDQLPAAQIFSQCLAQNPIPALHCVQLLRFGSQPGKEAGDAQIGPPRRLLLAMRAAHRQRGAAGVLGFGAIACSSNGRLVMTSRW